MEGLCKYCAWKNSKGKDLHLGKKAVVFLIFFFVVVIIVISGNVV